MSIKNRREFLWALSALLLVFNILFSGLFMGVARASDATDGSVEELVVVPGDGYDGIGEGPAAPVTERVINEEKILDTPEIVASDTQDAEDAVIKEASPASPASIEKSVETPEELAEAAESEVGADAPLNIEEGQPLPSPDEVILDTSEESDIEVVEEELVSEDVVEEPLALAVAAASPNTSSPSVTYRTHVQNVGWQNWVADGAMSGTSGKAYRLEGINIKLSGVSGGITYRTHVQNIGWQDWKSNGEMSGTSGKALRLEAIEIKLTGDAANKYDVYYRVHCQNIGWMGWAKNGERSGTAGYGYRLEGIQIKLVTKNGSAPSTTLAGVSQNSSSKFKDAGAPGLVNFRTHVQNVGWQNWVADGAMSGTSGKAYRLEGINIKLGGVSGGITYRTHVQNIGWQDWKSNGAMSGTSGKALRLEAIEIKLTGDAANKYDVYYRVHCQNIGWMGWAKNGASAGSAGYGYRLEAINIKLVAKNGAAPGSTSNTFAKKGGTTDAGSTTPSSGGSSDTTSGRGSGVITSPTVTVPTTYRHTFGNYTEKIIVDKERVAEYAEFYWDFSNGLKGKGPDWADMVRYGQTYRVNGILSDPFTVSGVPKTKAERVVRDGYYTGEITWSKWSKYVTWDSEPTVESILAYLQGWGWGVELREISPATIHSEISVSSWNKSKLADSYKTTKTYAGMQYRCSDGKVFTTEKAAQNHCIELAKTVCVNYAKNTLTGMFAGKADSGQASGAYLGNIYYDDVPILK